MKFNNKNELDYHFYQGYNVLITGEDFLVIVDALKNQLFDLEEQKEVLGNCDSTLELEEVNNKILSIRAMLLDINNYFKKLI